MLPWYLYGAPLPPSPPSLNPHLFPLVQDGRYGGVEAEDDLHHLGQVGLDEVAELVDYHRDDVEEAVLPAQWEHGSHVRLADRPLHRLHARTCIRVNIIDLLLYSG